LFLPKTGTPYGTQQKKESASSSLSPKWGAIYILCHIYLTHLPALFLPKTGTPYGTQQKKKSQPPALYHPKWGANFIIVHMYLTHIPALFLPSIKYK